MTAVAEQHDPERRDLWPTAPMPVVEQRGVYRAANHRRRVAIAAGAVGLVLLIGAFWALYPDDSSGRGGQPAVAAAPSRTVATTAPSTEPTTAEPTPSPTPSETPAPTLTAVTLAPRDPDEIVDQLRDIIGTLADNDELDDHDAEALEKRLDKLAEEIERGDRKAATRRFQQFAEKLTDLQKDDDISAAGFQSLALALSRLALSMPQVHTD
jgi:hypothetical protein